MKTTVKRFGAVQHTWCCLLLLSMSSGQRSIISSSCVGISRQRFPYHHGGFNTLGFPYYHHVEISRHFPYHHGGFNTRGFPYQHVKISRQHFPYHHGGFNTRCFPYYHHVEISRQHFPAHHRVVISSLHLHHQMALTLPLCCY